MEKGKKKSTGKTVTIVILIILLFGSFGYIGYDKFYVKENSSTTSKKEELSKEKEEKLDIHSRLVQTLYKKVSSENMENPNYYLFWKDYGKFDAYKGELPTDYLVNNSTELSKMAYVGYNLNSAKRDIVECSSLTSTRITKIINGNELAMHSECDQEFYSDNVPTITYAFSKNEVERVYKDLFGEENPLDTSIIISMDAFNAENYIYNEDLDKYVLYQIEGGGTGGPGGFTTKLEKAIRKNNEIKIYEKVKLEYYDSSDSEVKNPLYNESIYVYTFKQDSDNMYTFVNRIKEN